MGLQAGVTKFVDEKNSLSVNLDDDNSRSRYVGRISSSEKNGRDIFASSEAFIVIILLSFLSTDESIS